MHAREYYTEKRGEMYTPGYKVYIKRKDKIISPFHDIPLYPDPSNPFIINVINEIPRFSNAKMEINKEEEMNPIMQDIKYGEVRWVRNIYPFKGYMWNYGAIPQTWEDPERIDPRVTSKDEALKGDNDPLDVLEIGVSSKEVGQVYQAKVLGCISLIDENECDWKVIVIDINDPFSNEINELRDIERLMPTLLENTRKWFRDYKIPDGKLRNTFGMDGEYGERGIATEVIATMHKHWESLMSGPQEGSEGPNGISLKNSLLSWSKSRVTKAFVPKENDFIWKEEPLFPVLTEFYYLKEKGDSEKD